MSNDPTTSDDVKSVHQQCIATAKVDAALARAESPSGAINEGDAGLLAAEVRRLRAEVVTKSTGWQHEAGLRAAAELGVERWKQLCEARSNTAAAHKLARVEALPAKLRLAARNARRHEPEERAEAAGLRWAALKLDEALRDPQPSAAPTPKGEPYNGY